MHKRDEKPLVLPAADPVKRLAARGLGATPSPLLNP